MGPSFLVFEEDLIKYMIPYHTQYSILNTQRPKTSVACSLHLCWYYCTTELNTTETKQCKRNSASLYCHPYIDQPHNISPLWSIWNTRKAMERPTLPSNLEYRKSNHNWFKKSFTCALFLLKMDITVQFTSKYDRNS